MARLDEFGHVDVGASEYAAYVDGCEDGYQTAITDIAKVLAEQFGDEAPCNLNDNEELMWLYCGAMCEDCCGEVDTNICWEEFLRVKLRLSRDDKKA